VSARLFNIEDRKARRPDTGAADRRADGSVDELWSIEDVARFLRIPVTTLYQWRHRRKGPRASKVGRHLRYDPADVRSWLADQGGRRAS